MKESKLLFLSICMLLLLGGCSDDDVSPDEERPEIILTGSEAFPVQCSTLTRGQKFSFRARFTDNVALGSYSLDIHHNFDHHTHSTELEECVMSSVKAPVHPFLLISSFPIPEGLKEYEATAEIDIPEDVDPGDYHFMIRLTDKEGWQTIRGLSIKIN